MRLALAALLLTGCQSLTDVVVRVDADTMVVGEIASVAITVTDVDGSDGGTQVYASQALPICAAGQHDACYSFPITVTLKPGAHAPDTKVRVQVDSKTTDGSAFSSDAALFTFTPHSEKSLDFFLSPSCKSTDCAATNQACGTSGCAVLTPRTSNTALDMTQPIAPATSVSLVSSHPGAVQVQSMQPYTIDRVESIAGDLIVVAFLLPSSNGAPVIPVDWSELAQIDLTTEVLYRFADGSEADNATLFDFIGPDLGGATLSAPVQYAEYVFRGAVAPVHATMGSVVRGMPGFDGVAQIPMNAAGQLRVGGELVAIAINNDNGIDTCSPIAPTTAQLATDFALLQLPGVVGGSQSPFAVDCTNPNGGSADWVYSFVLNPAQ